MHFWTPDDLIYSVIDHDQRRFDVLLDELFDIPIDQYKIKVKDNVMRYCYFDKNNPPHIVIQNKLNDVLLEY